LTNTPATSTRRLTAAAIWTAASSSQRRGERPLGVVQVGDAAELDLLGHGQQS